MASATNSTDTGDFTTRCPSGVLSPTRRALDQIAPTTATTTSATGYWTISHATEGKFDVEIVNGTSIRRRIYSDEIQVKRIEVADLYLRNPADTFDLSIVPPAITADRIVNVPLIAQNITLGPVMADRNLTGDSTTGTVANATIITMSSLAIPVGSHVVVEAAFAKSTGHASYASLGLKLNATQVLADTQFTTANNTAESGHFRAEFTMGVAPFLLAGLVAAGTDTYAYQHLPFTTNMPAATLTDLIITGHVENALNLLSINYIRVYYEP